MSFFFFFLTQTPGIFSSKLCELSDFFISCSIFEVQGDGLLLLLVPSMKLHCNHDIGLFLPGFWVCENRFDSLMTWGWRLLRKIVDTHYYIKRRWQTAPFSGVGGSFGGAIPVHEDISASGRVLRKTAKVGVKLGIWSAADFSSEEVIALQGGQQQPCPRKKPQPHPDGASAVLTSEEKKTNASL